jgi:uncharacterized delta-60 repeat protein
MLDRFARPLLSALVLAVAVGTAYAHNPADLDYTFGNDGIARFPGQEIWGDARSPAGRIALVLSTSSGSLLPPSAMRVVQLDASGAIDPSFAPVGNFADFMIQAIAFSHAGRLVTLQSRYMTPQGALRATRHLADGTPDPSFGTAGAATLSEFTFFPGGHIGPTGQFIDTGITTDRSDRLYFAIDSRGDALQQGTWIDRVAASGSVVEMLNGSTSPPIQYQSLLVDRSDRLVALIYRREPALGGPELSGPALLRLVDGAPDRTFGARGLAYQAIPGWIDGAFSIGTAYQGHAATPDGGYVVVGRIQETPSSNVVAVVKFTEHGGFDRSFGTQGIARVHFGSNPSTTYRATIAVQADGDIVVAASLSENYLSLAGLARLTPAGDLDARFAPGGVTTFWAGEGAQANSLHLQPDGGIVVVGGINDRPSSGRPTAAVFRFNGGDLARARPLRERIAVEYFHAGYGHYFVTAEAHEIFNLDLIPASGWARTGKSFAVWDQDDPSLVQACRFWSDQSFAPKSSHVYTPHADECALLKAGSTWRFERNAFALRLPQGPASSECADDARPLYRAYNNASGGAPNHRYTVDPATLDEMIALGWTAEGAANTRVFACVPLP